MKIIKTTKQLQEYRKTITNNKIGFVPTMGALHEGHISLIKNSVQHNDCTIVSIFVNPTQFLANEDFSKYPNKNEADIKICELLDIDILFMPNIDDMYENDEIKITAPLIKGFILEGLQRAEHFDGVLQIVLKLFNIINPTNAYFGKKDAQQLALIQQLVKNYFLDINIVACDIVRDENGLALSSRNSYLNKEEKIEALKISKSLRVATQMILSNNLDSEAILKQMNNILENIQIEYLHIVSRDFKPLKTCEINNSIIIIAVKISNTRLLDNIWI
jgi:pantoate--beta-alanine ligase